MGLDPHYKAHSSSCVWLPIEKKQSGKQTEL